MLKSKQPWVERVVACRYIVEIINPARVGKLHGAKALEAPMSSPQTPRPLSLICTTFQLMPRRSIRDLKSCSGLVKSYAAVQRRLQTSVIHIGDQLGPVQQDGHQSFRARKEGRPLPLPPVLDPVVLSERGRWEQKKEKPNVEQFTPFQKKLWETPYGVYLKLHVF